MTVKAGARPGRRTSPATRREPDAGGAEARKEERVELRTTADEKRLLVAAASQEHLDVTAFVLRSALPAAREVVDRASTTQLTARDTARILDLLEHPPEPNDRLRRAASAVRANAEAAAHAPPPARGRRKGSSDAGRPERTSGASGQAPAP